MKLECDKIKPTASNINDDTKHHRRSTGRMYQLDGGHVFLPPQKLLEAWSSSREAVVEVHDDMDGRVHHGMERSHSTWINNHKLDPARSDKCNHRVESNT